MKTNHKKKNNALFPLIMIFFCIQWLFLLSFSHMYYAVNNATTVQATVVETKLNEEKGEEEIYISYNHNENTYEHIFYCSYKNKWETPEKNMMIDARINSKSPEKPILPLGVILDNFAWKTRTFALISSFVLLWFCVNTIYKIVKTKNTITKKGVINYIKNREAFRMVLATTTIYLNHFLTRDGSFFIIFVLSMSIIIRSLIRIIRTTTNNSWIQFQLSTCLSMESSEEGVDLDSRTLHHNLKTDSETFSLYGYGRAAYFCSNIFESDKILAVRFGCGRKLYMLLSIPKDTPCEFEQLTYKAKKSCRFTRLISIIMIIAACFFTRFICNYCNHTYNEFVTHEPTSQTEGSIVYACSKCYNKIDKSIAKLRADIDVTVIDKYVTYRNPSSIEIEGQAYPTSFGNELESISYVIQLKNTGEKDIQRVTTSITVKDLNGNELSKFNADFSEKVLSVGETTTHTATDYIVPTVTSIEEKMNKIELSDASLEELQFDYEITDIIYLN